MHTALEEFGRKQLLIQRQINNLQMVFEELCVQTLMPLGGDIYPMRFTASVSESDGTCEGAITYGGDPYNPFEVAEEELSVRMVARLCKEHHWRSHEGNNHLTVVF